MTLEKINAAVGAAVDQCNASPLPFVELDPGNPDCPRSAWTVKETGDQDTDLMTGFVYAQALIECSKRIPRPVGIMAIEAVVSEIVKKGHLGPIERGFIGRLAMAVMAASQN